MTPKELISKLDRARQDLTDGYQTEEDYLKFISDVFDGNLDYALEREPERTPAPLQVPLGMKIPISASYFNGMEYQEVDLKWDSAEPDIATVVQNERLSRLDRPSFDIISHKKGTTLITASVGDREELQLLIEVV